ARPRTDQGVGLSELGLPFASDPEITRHLARFLATATDPTSEDSAPPAPTAVLFNGGALKAAAMRARILDVIESWYGSRPIELAGGDLDLAVARGAAAYGRALRGHGGRIAGGAARAYYVGVAAARDASGAESARHV